jgi:hypothetical protein
MRPETRMPLLPTAERNVSCICQTGAPGAPAGRLGLRPPPSTCFPCCNDQFLSTDARDKSRRQLRNSKLISSGSFEERDVVTSHAADVESDGNELPTLTSYVT